MEDLKGFLILVFIMGGIAFVISGVLERQIKKDVPMEPVETEHQIDKTD